jgi:hypothetical protein
MERSPGATALATTAPLSVSPPSLLEAFTTESWLIIHLGLPGMWQYARRLGSWAASLVDCTPMTRPRGKPTSPVRIH